MSISYGEIFPILAIAVPDFEPSEADWAEPLPYVFMHQMMEFVCRKAAASSHDYCEQFAALLENLAIEGDEETQGLVLDVIEDLRECESKELIAEHFGPRVRYLWEEVSQPSYLPDEGPSGGWPKS
jgi:hypothetical protein